MIWQSERVIREKEEKEKELFEETEENDQGNKINQAFDMMDKMMSLGNNSKVKMVTSTWRYVVNNTSFAYILN